MLMPAMCAQCLRDALSGAGPIPKEGLPIRTKVLPVQTLGLYRTKCGQGHSIVMIADFQQFELLFESAMEAFADMYFRESVSSFAAALERFHEFSIRTMLIAQEVDVRTISSMWKSVASQSERQLGMFAGLYSITFKRPPSILTTEESNFRNKVIHKGHFPSPEEAFKFGKSIYGLINSGIKELRTKFPKALEEAQRLTRQGAIDELRTGETPQTFGISTAVSLMVQDEPRPMHDAINAVAARLQRQRDANAFAPTRPNVNSSAAD